MLFKVFAAQTHLGKKKKKEKTIIAILVEMLPFDYIVFKPCPNHESSAFFFSFPKFNFRIFTFNLKYKQCLTCSYIPKVQCQLNSWRWLLNTFSLVRTPFILHKSLLLLQSKHCCLTSSRLTPLHSPASTQFPVITFRLMIASSLIRGK